MALTDQLVAWWSLDEASGTRSDSHGANDPTDNNTVTAEAAKQSNGALFVAANSEYLSIADNAALSGSDRDFMLCGWVLLNSYPATTCGIIGKGNGISNASGEYYLRYNHSSTRFQWRAFTGSASATITDISGAPALETWYFIELWHDATNNQVGIRVNRGTAVTAAFAGPVADTTGVFRMGQDPSGANYFDGVMDEWGFWDRLLTSDELDTLYNGGAGVSYADISGGGGTAYTLTADSGAYSLAGQAAALLAARRIDAASGTYATSGQAASLLAGRRLAAESGTYALTGQAASLLAARLLTAETGAYALAGQDATLAYTPLGGYTLSAESGSYALSGQSATLLRGYVLSAESGAYEVTGHDADLLRGYLMQASSGAYTLSGQAAGLALARVLQAASGSYTLSGQAVTLVYSGAEVPVTPDSRIFIVAAEARIYVIAAESRAYTVPSERRVYAVSA